MHDICYWHFVAWSCAVGVYCPKAHSLSQLENAEHWVVFRIRNVSIADYMVPQSLKIDRGYFLPGKGSLIRCRTPTDAADLMELYQGYGNPVLLSSILCPEIGSEAELLLLLFPGSSRPVGRGSLAPLHISLVCSQADGYLVSPTSGSAAGPSCSSSSLTVSTDALGFCKAGTCPQESDVDEDSPRSTISEELVVYRPMAALSAKVAGPVRDGEQPAQATAPTDTTAGKGFVAEAVADAMSVSPKVEKPIKKRKDAISQKMWSKLDKKNCSHKVFHVLRQFPALRATNTAGWGALYHIWGIRPSDLDPPVLMNLYMKPPRQQEQILLTFAAIGLCPIENLSAYLNCLIREHETNPQVCMFFLADVCDGQGCTYVHPEGTPGWNLLQEKWGYTYKDFDYPVLNYLAKKPLDQQESILQNFASLNLDDVQNLSAFLSSVIHKMEKMKPLKPVNPLPVPTSIQKGPNHSQSFEKCRSSRPLLPVGYTLSQPSLDLLHANLLALGCAQIPLSMGSQTTPLSLGMQGL